MKNLRSGNTKRRLLSMGMFIVIMLSDIITYCSNGYGIEDYNFLNEEESVTDTLESEELVESKSAYLCEGESGRVLYEKDAYKQLAPASITKIMTLLLIFEAIDDGKINNDDMVTVSEHAASMGGSQVFLEPAEQQTVDTMIKCISISSANDACVAMAEYIAGSEEEFVKKMNEKAAALGMENTHFVNCCGLDVKGHYSCAADIATMGRELITKYPEISDYATTWMDTIVHKTRKGEKEFGLTNTNKLVRTYDGITGLKTGSTNNAGYCLCATSKRGNLTMIAVVMSSTDHKSRFSDCAKLMDYGYGKCSYYEDDINDNEELKNIPVKGSLNESVDGVADSFSYVLTDKESEENISYEVSIDTLVAPVNEGDVIGSIRYYYDDSLIGQQDICADRDVKKVTFKDCLRYLVKNFLKIYY